MSFHPLLLTTDKNVASGEPLVPVVSSIFTNEYGNKPFRFGVLKMPLIQNTDAIL
jgi:hypothetical protein